MDIMADKFSMKKMLSYMAPIVALGSAGAFFGPVGVVVGALLGFFVGRRLAGDKKYAAAVKSRQKISDSFYAYAGVGLAGFVFFNVPGLLIGVGALWLFNRYVVKKK
jgi:hypothetical protein